MIILAQALDPTSERWEDVKVPRKVGPPKRGQKTLYCITPEEMSDELVKFGMTGTYRIVTDAGEIFRIIVTKRDAYTAEIMRESPNV